MNPTLPLPAELLKDPLYSRLKEYLIGSTGLVYYADKDTDLARRILRRLSNLARQDCASYLELLRDPSRGPSEMDALIAEITIGETYFFRHREHFDALRDVVLPDLIARNAGTRRLQIWCAGCADGAEPYSLSILLRRELAHMLPGWDVSILGTDINRQCLASARQGRFEDWSLRATSDDLKRSCFEEQGRHWIIAPEYKAGVSFQFHNLVEDACPSHFNDCSAFDLIICRNVMIYFGPELMQRITQQFHDCLAPGAWLLVGPSEPNMTCFKSFRAVNAPGVTLYQRPAQSVPEVAAAVFFPDFPLPIAPQSNTVKEPAARPETDRPIPTVADLRRYANQGDWENALRFAKELLDSDNLNALVHFHYALVQEQLGNHAESERSLRRAIYLDRQAVLTHYHLGRLLQSRGEWRQAARSFNNALELLESLPDEAALTDADGLTVAELRKVTQTQAEGLRGQA